MMPSSGVIAARAVVSAFTLVVGLLAAVRPARAAGLWAPSYLRRSSGRSRKWLLLRYRALGFLLVAAALLGALDDLWVANPR